jgi:hypothetical protein
MEGAFRAARRKPFVRPVWALVALVAAIGCARTPEGSGRMPPPLDVTYSDGAAGLKKLWEDILVAAQKDDRERVHALVASLTMSDEDLVALFGAERGRALLPRYLPMISTLVNAGAMELVARITERKYDEIEVFSVDEKGSDADRATLRALVVRTPVYGVRVKRKGGVGALRYDFFVYRNGHWVTGNLLAKYLTAPPADGGR